MMVGGPQPSSGRTCVTASVSGVTRALHMRHTCSLLATEEARRSVAPSTASPNASDDVGPPRPQATSVFRHWKNLGYKERPYRVSTHAVYGHDPTIWIASSPYTVNDHIWSHSYTVKTTNGGGLYRLWPDIRRFPTLQHTESSQCSNKS